MVRLAVLRKTQDLAELIAKETNLSPLITLGLLKDESGEALIAASHYLGLPEDASVQIATLLYPALTHTRQQIAALRQLYRSFNSQATKRIVEAWRALPYARAAQHETVHAASAEPGAQISATISTPQNKYASNQ
jgi:hypothetical protein